MYMQGQQTANVMDQFGSDLIASRRNVNIEKLREQRLKRGECQHCGQKTHKVSTRFPLGRKPKREPLTVEGEVVNGQCLRCHPVEGHAKQGSDKPPVPEVLEVDDDGMTVASEITMDPCIMAPPFENPHNSWPARPAAAGRGGRANRSHHTAGRFESVEEETPITDFGRRVEAVAGNIDKLENERRDRERQIVREQELELQESRALIRGRQDEMPYSRQRQRPGVEGGGGRRISEGDEKGDTESEESIELWENHEHLLGRQQREQRFHPLAVQHNLSMSENSISISNDDMEGRPGRPLAASHGTAGAHAKQKFHPLAREALFSASELSERSLSLGSAAPSEEDEGSQDSGALSKQSSDSDRILRLCQGSRGNLMMEVEKSPPRGDCPSPAARVPSRGEGDARRSNNASSRKQRASETSAKRGSWLKRLPSPPSGSAEEIDPSNPSGSVRRSGGNSTGRKSGGRRAQDSNRFSLTWIDNSAKDSSNRFSFQKKRRSTDNMPPNLQMEMNASKNWDSTDILRDAAAEANGEDLDAKVDALFGLGSIVGVANAIPPRPNDGEGVPRSSPPPLEPVAAPSSGASDASTLEEDEDQMGGDAYNEVDAMTTAMSRGPAAHEEEVIATTIQQRRCSALSLESGEVCPTTRRRQHLSSMEDIPVIIRTVRLRPTDERCTERAFQSLFLLATDPDPEGALARREILAQGGMEALVSAMWDHMGSAGVLLASFHALWAVSAFPDEGEEGGEDASDPGSRIQGCGVLEGLLFAMQQHAADPIIQDSGCDLITRLAGLLPEDTPEFKSAVVILCSNVQGIDICDAKAYSSCLDALNTLCQLSDENKREFANAGNDCHNAVIRGLTRGDPPSLETQELACQLFWCITSDRAAVSLLSSNGGLLSRKIIDALKNVPRVKSSVHFYGAACGTLANLALEPSNHGKMIGLGVVPILCEAIYIYAFSVEVNSAACTALANLSASRVNRKLIATQGGIPALFSAVKTTSDNVNVQSEAFRALHNLCESSPTGKQAIAADLEIIITSLFIHEAVKYIQQITCSILCRLSADGKCRKSMIMLLGTFDALAKIMKSNKKKKLVQKAACSALKNLSKEEDAIPILLSKGFDSLVIDAMDTYGDSEELQECACTFLMNMGSNSPEASVEICSGEGIHCIIKSMQTIPTSASLQQASCGALYAVTKGDAHKNMAISAGAVDAVIYLMLVHPDEVGVLENAVNVLVNLSSLRKCTRTIAESGGISTVTEVMRSNPASAALVIGGSRFIQNMALSRREYADEALGGITPMLGCMDEHPGCARLVEESCKALRCLVLKSETCRDRLINADGVAVIEKTMEENGASQRWQTLLLDELFQ